MTATCTELLTELARARKEGAPSVQIRVKK